MLDLGLYKSFCSQCVSLILETTTYNENFSFISHVFMQVYVINFTKKSKM